MGPEKTFENKVKKFLKEKGCWYIKYWGGADYTRAGIPDLIICCNGNFIAIELKSNNGKPSDLQLHQINQIKKSGGLAMVLYPKDFDNFKNMIEVLL